MSRDNMLWVYDMAEAIDDIFLFTDSYNLSHYLDDPKTIAAVERKLSIIGEAAAQITESFRDENQQVPWQLVKGFRNILIHEYFGIDQTIVWKIVQESLPALRKQLEMIIAAAS